MHRVTKTKLSEGIFFVRFATQYELASTFLRFQEHFESSRFSGRTFSLETFMDWYASKFGAFSYFEDWTGFNIPSTALDPFLKGEFDPLLEKEDRFLRLFEEEKRPFYIIGISNASSQGDLVHELAHAMFFCDARYRSAVLAAMRAFKTSAVERELRALGYARRVIKDEVHAYLISGDDSVRAASSRHLKPLRKTLQSLFRTHGAALIATVARMRGNRLRG
jgi:hypothetical protein